MVFSTGVLAVAFLKIPISGSKFLGLDLAEVEPRRVWLGTLAALLYLVLRYWHDPPIRELAAEWKKRGKDIYQKLAAATIDAAFEERERKRFWKPVMFDISKPPHPTARPHLGTDFSFTSWRSGNVGTTWTGEPRSDGVLHMKVVYARDGLAWFRIHWLKAAWLAVQTFLRMLRVSWTVLEIVVPVVLAVSAAAVAIFRVAKAFC